MQSWTTQHTPPSPCFASLMKIVSAVILLCSVAAAAGVTKTESVDKADNAQHDGYGWGGHGGNGHWDMIDHGECCCQHYLLDSSAR